MILERTFLSAALPGAQFIVNGITDFASAPSFAYEDKEVAFSIDSRTIRPGELFVVLQGKRCHGSDFIADALEKGASAVLCDRASLKELLDLAGSGLAHVLVIVVDEVIVALGTLARAWRMMLPGTMVAITGSVGKTTTKELVRSMLVAAHQVAFIAHKNENNFLGVAINLLSMRRDHHVGVFEFGTSARGEIAVLAALVRPSIALITAVAHAHGEGLGSLHDIAHEKLSLFSVLGPTDRGIICGDQPLLDKAYYYHPVARFGKKMKNQVQARKIRYEHDQHGQSFTHFTLKLYDQDASVQLMGIHHGLIMNVLAASTVGAMLDLPFEAILQGIASYRGVAERFEEHALAHNKGRVISDCYNANPESMKAALAALDTMKSSGEKIAVIGDMFELGEKESYWHRQIGRFLRNMKTVSYVVLVGERSKFIAKTAPFNLPCVHVATWQDAVSAVEQRIEHNTGSLVLVKASRGMHLERVVNKLLGKGT